MTTSPKGVMLRSGPAVHGEDMEVQGNIVDHEYRISQGGEDIAEVSKKWFRIADTYGVGTPGTARCTIVNE